MGRLRAVEPRLGSGRGRCALENAREPEDGGFTVLRNDLAQSPAVPEGVAELGELHDAGVELLFGHENRLKLVPEALGDDRVLELAEVEVLEQCARAWLLQAGVAGMFPGGAVDALGRLLHHVRREGFGVLPDGGTNEFAQLKLDRLDASVEPRAVRIDLVVWPSSAGPDEKGIGECLDPRDQECVVVVAPKRAAGSGWKPLALQYPIELVSNGVADLRQVD